MIGTYDPVFVALSVLIAVVAAYRALDMATRILAERGRRRVAWLIGGSIVMGIGIWSMYTEMAAAEFTFTGAPTLIPPGAVIGTDELTALVVISSLAVFGLALVAGAADRRRRLLVMEQARREAAESARERIVSILDSITDMSIALDRDWRLT